MTLGNLIEFPELEVLHLYRFGDNMAGTQDPRFIDQKEYVIIWQIYMPNLREVALSPDVIWACSLPMPHATHRRRVKRVWSRYTVEPMEGVEGLLIVPCPKEARKYEALGRERRIFRQSLTSLNGNMHATNVLGAAQLFDGEDDTVVEEIPDDIEDEQDFQ